MTPYDVPADLKDLVNLCEQAGRAILAVRKAGFRVDSKDDASPVTAADLAANEILVEGLAACSTLPILSEEGRVVPWAERQKWRRFWLLDPLDGTREFVDGFDDFTVNVALIEAGRPVLGVVHAPALGTSWAGTVEEGAWRWQESERQTIHVAPLRVAPRWPPRILASRAHLDAATREWIAAIPGAQLSRCGSSVKFCRIAEGRADLYPRFSPTCEWDTAAGQAVLEAAGGAVLAAETLDPLRCQQGESLVNGHFIACAVPAWRERLAAVSRQAVWDETKPLV
ncbi:MAG: 3'(2'),5'-bisphosphate nucleotidase CysQ [Halomonas sp.]|uniref:3'(2'),5'-bisphosphate nucleotidase CysQ n=1 Tax=Halomonas sp. TaxID=1486246 RepID=UPI0019EEBF1B|nr:3'(2'),5'-bisphosphate nucleotidase CysQ [Halomonas sp.]MBE0487845.1 3'(2'),5'-bisphosphate nucleotidase CysQ [Halomonas sp.]